MKYLHFDEIKDGDSFFYSVFIGRELKNLKMVKSGNYGITDNPIVKKVKMNSNDLIQVL